MPQKWYLRATTLNPHPTSGEKSTTEPVGAQTYGLTPTDLDLNPVKGASATSAATTLPNSTTANNGTLGRWSSAPLAAGTYGSGSWTIAIQTTESDANYNVFWRSASLYFYRPSNNTVVGFVIDSNTQSGVEFGNGVANARYGQVLTWTGANVTIQDGDILVFEAWTGGTPSMAGASRTATIFYDGTTDVTAAYAGTDPASYIQAPANIPSYLTGSVSDALFGSDTASTNVVVARTASDSLLGSDTAAGQPGKARSCVDYLLGWAVVAGSIALDASANGSNGPNTNPPQSLTVSHTLGAGTDRCVVVVGSTESGGTNGTLSCTYNGVTMTQAVEVNVTGTSNQRTAIFYLLDASLPAAGTYNVVLTEATGSAPVYEMLAVVYSLTGVGQSGQPDATASNTNTTGASSYSDNITTIADRAWVVTGLGDGNQAGGSVTATNGAQANVTTVNQASPFNSSLMASTLATTTAGVYSSGFQGLSPNYNRVSWAATSFVASSSGSIAAADDVATRGLLLARSIADALFGADTATRALVLARSTSDALFTSDTATGQPSKARSVSDSLISGDVATRQLSVARTAGDALFSADAATRGIVETRSASDALALSDVASRQLTLSRAATADALLSADAATRSSPRARTAADAIALSDVATRLLVQTRASADTLFGADAATRGSTTTTRSTSDTVALSDVATRQLTTTRATSDVLLGGDTAARAQPQARTAADALLVSDAAARALAAARSTSDALLGGDTAARSLIETRSTSDVLLGSDSAAPGSGNRTASDALLGVDSAARQLVEQRASSDALLGADTAARSVSPARQGADALLVGDVVSRATGAHRASLDALLGGDAATGSRALVRAVADHLLGGDVASPHLVFARLVVDVLLGGDSAVAVHGVPAHLAPGAGEIDYAAHAGGALSTGAAARGEIATRSSGGSLDSAARRAGGSTSPQRRGGGHVTYR